MHVLCLDLAKHHSNPFLLSIFKINATGNFEDIFLYIFSGYQTIIFHLKFLILIVL